LVAIADYPDPATVACIKALRLAASSFNSCLPKGNNVTVLAFMRCMPSGLFAAIHTVSLNVTEIKSGASSEMYSGLKKLI
jgi:predicted metal-binding protein